MIPIIWTVTSATASGSTWRVVRCESCRKKYIFQIQAEGYGEVRNVYGIGSESAGRQARKAAMRDLKRRLRRDSVPTPCPGCGWYQADMVKELRQRTPSPFDVYTVVILGVGLSALAFALLSTLLRMVSGPGHRDDLRSALLTLIAGATVSGVGLSCWGAYRAITRRAARQSYDPNKAVSRKTRIERGRQRATLLKDFLQQYPDTDLDELQAI